jgi:hypothetical protein
MSDDNRPSARINLRPVSATIWRKEAGKGVFYSVQFEKSYKDRSGKWQSTSSFEESDLLLVAKAANMAHDEIQEQHRKDQHAAGHVAEAS